MTRRKVYQLVPDSTSDDTVDALRALLRRAKRGELIGLGYVVMYRGRKYTAGVAGECRNNPTFTRGMLCALDDSLCEMLSGD